MPKRAVVDWNDIDSVHVEVWGDSLDDLKEEAKRKAASFFGLDEDNAVDELVTRPFRSYVALTNGPEGALTRFRAEIQVGMPEQAEITPVADLETISRRVVVPTTQGLRSLRESYEDVAAVQRVQGLALVTSEDDDELDDEADLDDESYDDDLDDEEDVNDSTYDWN